MRKYDAWRYAKMRRLGMERIELVVVGITLLFAVLLILAWVYVDREKARRSQCVSRLRVIGFAIHNYYNSYHVFPLGVGTKGESCLLPLLPFLGEPMDEPLATYDHVNKIPANDPFFHRDRSWFRCPCESVTDETRMSTSYHGCAGDRIEFFSTTELENEAWTARNIFGQCDDSTKLRWYTHESVSDGLNNTIAFAESRIATGRAATHREDNTSLFTDWNATTTEAIPSRCMANSETFDVSIQTAMNYALGAKWYDGRMTCTRFLTILPPNAPSCVQGEETNLPLISASSYHLGGVNCREGGVNVLLFDGSVGFTTDKVDVGNLDENAIFTYRKGSGDAMAPIGFRSPFGVWGAMGTMCGDEIVGFPETPHQTEETADETTDHEPTSVEACTENGVEDSVENSAKNVDRADNFDSEKNVDGVENMENLHSSSDGSL